MRRNPLRGSVRRPEPMAARLRLARPGDAGVALVAVIGSMAVMMVFLLSALAYVLQNNAPARAHQDAKIAVSAAEAGLDEYVSRLNADPTYYTQGNGDATNPAFSTGTTIQRTGGSSARYSYQVLTTPSETAQNGVIRLRVTGSSSVGPGRPAVSRTLTATLRPRGFLSYIYLSDLEVSDPALVSQATGCQNYWYAGRSSLGAGGCSNIQWSGGDTVNGPLHSNDQLRIEGGANFRSPLTTSSWPALNVTNPPAKSWWGSRNPPLAGYSPRYAPPLGMPAHNNELLEQVAPDRDGDTATPPGDGCYYTGATAIEFQGTTMRVRSPSTSASDTPSRCLDVGNRANWQVKPIPPVIYVDRTTASCTTGAIGYPAAGDSYTAGASTAFSWGDTTNYHCQQGTAYVKGTVDGEVTVSGKNDVVVTDNLTTQDGGGGADIVGLIAGNFVWVYHPVRSNGTNLLSTADTVTRIDAAILSITHSFVVQNWSQGAALGTLNVNGAIAQKYRGPVGTGSGTTISTGYYKNYVYDARLAYLQPPFFLRPEASPWQVSNLTDR
jgi:Tfp pilus assembly protein PilX